jgi:hypothetical protein
VLPVQIGKVDPARGVEPLKLAGVMLVLCQSGGGKRAEAPGEHETTIEIHSGLQHFRFDTYRSPMEPQEGRIHNWGSLNILMWGFGGSYRILHTISEIDLMRHAG